MAPVQPTLQPAGFFDLPTAVRHTINHLAGVQFKGFFDLPAEIRNMIYKILFGHNVRIKNQRQFTYADRLLGQPHQQPRKDNGKFFLDKHQLSAQLLRVNKACLQEAQNVLYGSNTFVAENPVIALSLVHQCIGVQKAFLIKSLEISYIRSGSSEGWAMEDMANCVLKIFTSLEELCVQDIGYVLGSEFAPAQLKRIHFIQMGCPRLSEVSYGIRPGPPVLNKVLNAKVQDVYFRFSKPGNILPKGGMVLDVEAEWKKCQEKAPSARRSANARIWAAM